MKKPIILYLLLLMMGICLSTYGQDYLHIKGRLVDSKMNKITGLVFVTDTANKFVKIIETHDGEFKINLLLKTQYILTFMGVGYKAKTIDINTLKSGNFEFIVEMFKSVKYEDPVAVASVYYNQNTNRYDYFLYKHLIH